MPVKCVKMKILKKKNTYIFFLKSQGSFNPKIRFLCQKSVFCSPITDRQKHRQTHTNVTTMGSGHPFRVSVFHTHTRTSEDVQSRYMPLVEH